MPQQFFPRLRLFMTIIESKVYLSFRISSENRFEVSRFDPNPENYYPR